MLTRERLCTNHMRSAAIYEFYPDSAGKLTGMFLEATEVSLWVWQTMHTSKVSPTLKKHTRTCPDMAAFPSVLSRTWQSLEDLCLLLFSPRYLQLHLAQAKSVLDSSSEEAVFAQSRCVLCVRFVSVILRVCKYR